MVRANGKPAVTKLDAALKEEIEKFIVQPENRFEYPSLKNFIDKAVHDYLKKLKEGKK